MQALDLLEDTWSNVENEISEGDTHFFAEAYEAMDELAVAQQRQARFQDDLNCTRESLEIPFRELKNCRTLHDAACDDLEDASKRTLEVKRKADDAHDRTRSHRERCRHATKDFTMAEEVLHNNLGCLRDLVKDTASATHALSCGVPDRDSDEAKYLREALEMIDEFQNRSSLRSSAGREGQETREVILVERP